MTPKYALGMVTLAALTTGSALATDSYKLPEWSSDYSAKPQVVAAGAAALLARPQVGLKFGVGQWNQGVVGVGLDVSFKVPFIPLPALRFDAEAWSRWTDIGGNLRGHSIALLGVQTFTLAYVGIGPSYWFTSEHGNHDSGLGLKLVAGASLPKSFYIEGSAMIGPNPIPVFLWVGMKF